MSSIPDGLFEPERLYTVAEVMAMFRVSKMSVHRMIATGELPAVRQGRRFLIVGKELAAAVHPAALGEDAPHN